MLGSRFRLLQRIITKMGATCSGVSDHTALTYRENQRMPASFELADLADLSNYPTEAVAPQAIRSSFTNEHAAKLFGPFLAKLQQAKQAFEDPKYKLTGSVIRLSQFYTKRTPPKMFASSGSEALQQANKQFTYLSAVFCYIANNPDLLQQLMLVEYNETAFYLARLFPNGEPMNVAVDDIVPRDKEKLLHSKAFQFELWMFVLEKAWTKLIGGYESACGLSPEDAFEEIIGAPAYSYVVVNHDRKSQQQLELLIRRKKRQNMCIIFTAHEGDYEATLSRQVFYFQGFENCAGLEFVKLRCPYTNFKFTGELHERAKRFPELDRLVGYSDSHPGTIFASPSEVFNLFEFCTIGFYKQGYQTATYPFTSKFNEAVFFNITVQKKEPINLRICQYYEGYVRDNLNYCYSPVYIQMFRVDSRKLMFEGCRRAIYRSKSSNVFEQIFEDLDPGNYFLKFDVEWMFPDRLNWANLVSYSRSPLRIRQLSKQEGLRQHDLLIKSVIRNEPCKQTEGLQYGSKWMRNSVYLFYNNLTEKQLRLTVNLRKSHNLIPIEGSFREGMVKVNLPPNGSQLVQLRKQRVDQQGSLGQYMIEMD